MSELGVLSQIALENPEFSGLLWRLTPASLARRVSGGAWRAWPYLQLLSRKLVDVAMGKCPRLIVTCPPRHGKETSIWSLVSMADGSRKLLKDICIGDVVVTQASRGRRVTEIFEHPRKNCVEIVTKTGRRLVAELSHPVLTSIGLQKAGEVRIGQALAILRHFEANRSSGRTLEEFRILGYLIGDGCVTTSSILACVDPEEKEDFVACVGSIGSTCRITPEAVYLHKVGVIWTMRSGIFGKGAYQKELPPWAFEASNLQISHLLGAYLATDGSVSDPTNVRKSDGYGRSGERIGCTIEYSSVSKKLLEQTQHLLSRIDIVSRLRPKLGKYKGKDHHSWRLIITDRRSLLNFIEQVPVRHSVKGARLREWLPLLLENPSVHPQLSAAQIDDIRTSPHTYSRLAASFNVGERVIWNIKKGIGKNLPHDELYFYDEVVSISSCVEDCRCLTVDEDEMFVANDFVVHNSEMVSKWFPLWYIENFPTKRVILCSYEMEFASKWGGKVRDIISENQDILSLRFKAKMPAMHSWEVQEGGSMVCAGAGGPITGKGADVLIIDDPVKNSEEAESLVQREKLWDWYLTTARTRLEPGGSIVVMMTRWHSDDLIGRLINPNSYPEKGLKDEWEVYNFPAVAEPDADLHYSQFGVAVNNLSIGALSTPLDIREANESGNWTDVLGRRKGEPLCPDRYNEEDLAKIRGGSSPKVWFSMYQQRPGDEADLGNVYHCFDEAVHLVPCTRNDLWRLFVALDFNVDPMCAVIGQYDPGYGQKLMERCEILEEVILPDSNTYAMCDVLREKFSRYKAGYTLYLEVYGDASGTQKSANSKKTNWQIVADHLSLDTHLHWKFLRRERNPNIADRINAVNSLLKSADGTVRLAVSPGCRELIKDFKKVVWQTDAAGNSTGLIDKTRKDRTHVSDALGYFCEFRFGMKSRAGGRKGVMM